MPGTLEAMNRSADGAQACRSTGCSAIRSLRPVAWRLGHEALELLGPVAELQLQEARAGARLLGARSDAVVERRRARVLDRADEEVRARGRSVRPERYVAGGQRAGDRDQLHAVEVEHAPGLGLVAGGDVVAGQARDVLDPVHRRADDVGLEREPVAVAADELHDRLDAELREARSRPRAARQCACAEVLSVALNASTQCLHRLELAADLVQAAAVDRPAARP